MNERPLIPTPTGATRLIAHLGCPVTQVQAPMLLNQLYAEHGLDYHMIAMQVAPSGLDCAVRGLQSTDNVVGILVTVLHKPAICSHATTVSHRVAITGAANALRRLENGTWEAENFDGLGFIAGLKQRGFEIRGKRVVLFGAGGAGSAIAVGLADAGAAILRIVDTQSDKARVLAQKIEKSTRGISISTEPELRDCDIAINATTCGMSPDDPLPFDVSLLQAGALVCDTIAKPR